MEVGEEEEEEEVVRIPTPGGSQQEVRPFGEKGRGCRERGDCKTAWNFFFPSLLSLPSLLQTKRECGA